MALLETRQLNYSYKGQRVLKDLNLTFREGEFVGICGKNGSGKSTLAKLLGGLLFSEEGEVLFDGTPLTEKTILDLRSSLSMVFQNPNNQIITSRVIDDLAFGLENQGMNRERMGEAIQRVAHSMGIGGLLDRNPRELSGGQKQLVAIAGVLLFNPRVIILDEVTSMLGRISREKVFTQIQALRRDRTILMISHNSSELAQTDRILLLHQGELFEDQRTENFFSSPALLEHHQLEEPFQYRLRRFLSEEGITL